MRLERVGEKEWEEFLSGADRSSPFHEIFWLRALEHHSRLKAIRILGYRGREPVVGLPAFEGRKGFVKLFLSPPPGYSIPFLGPVFRGMEGVGESRRQGVFREFVEALRADFLRGYWTLTKIDLGPWAQDVRPFIEGRFRIRPRYTYRIDLRAGHEAAWKRMDWYVRRAARAAAGTYEFRPASSEEIGWILEQVHERYEAQRRGVKSPRAYVDRLLALAPPGRMQAYVGVKEGDLVTGSLCVADEATMYLWLAPTKRTKEHRHANEALLNDLLRRAAESGYEWFDLVGANTPGIAHFKAKFNPTLVPYASVDRIPSPGRVLIRMQGLGG